MSAESGALRSGEPSSSRRRLFQLPDQLKLPLPTPAWQEGHQHRGGDAHCQDGGVSGTKHIVDALAADDGARQEVVDDGIGDRGWGLHTCLGVLRVLHAAAGDCRAVLIRAHARKTAENGKKLQEPPKAPVKHRGLICRIASGQIQSATSSSQG
jgi:hypothetical protein